MSINKEPTEFMTPADFKTQADRLGDKILAVVKEHPEENPFKYLKLTDEEREILAHAGIV